jgi:hypothetical protein
MRRLSFLTVTPDLFTDLPLPLNTSRVPALVLAPFPLLRATIDQLPFLSIMADPFLTIIPDPFLTIMPDLFANLSLAVSFLPHHLAPSPFLPVAQDTFPLLPMAVEFRTIIHAFAPFNSAAVIDAPVPVPVQIPVLGKTADVAPVIAEAAGILPVFPGGEGIAIGDTPPVM